ncbi:MAG: YitT family protein [Alistipes sp.]|nr:YitT family protein [Alistipes sp.]
MAPITITAILKTIKEYVVMASGMLFYSFGWVACILPNEGTGGGASGLALVITQALSNTVGVDIQIGTMVLIINGILLLISGFIVGWNFGIKTIYCVVVLSLSMNMWQMLFSDPETGAVVDILKLADPIVAIVLGGVCAGIGIVICFSQGGSTGGTDIAAVIINHYRTVSYGKILIYSDLFIIGSALLLFKQDPETGEWVHVYSIATVIYGYIMTAVVGYTVDMIQAGSQQSTQVLIVTKDPEKMAEAIANNVHRGVTLLDAQGWYSKSNTKVVMVVCRKRETQLLLKHVKTVDPNAFMTVGSVVGVYGQGFETLKI